MIVATVGPDGLPDTAPKGDPAGFMHCGKSSVRSGIWKPEAWPDRSTVPTIAESLKANAGATESLEELQRREDAVTITRLY